MPAICPTESLRLDPRVLPFKLDTLRTSPTRYPDPPALIVAAVATFPEIVIFAVALTPDPVTLVKETPL